MRLAPHSPDSALRQFSSPLAANVLEELWFGDDDPNRPQETAKRSLAASAAKAAGRKPFPAVALRVMKLVQSEDLDIAKLRQEIEADPALASRLVRVANSAAFRPSHPYGSLDEVVVRLGARAVGEIVGAVAVAALFEDLTGLGQQIRAHSAAVAAIARTLGQEWRRGGVPQLFLAALMHDVGKLMLLQTGEAPYATFDPAALDAPDAVHLHERRTLGFDHSVLGAHVLERWDFPLDLCRVVAWHHAPGRAYEIGGDIGLSVALIRLADKIDYQILRDDELDPVFVEALASQGEATYADYSAALLNALWPKLVNARIEVLGAVLR